MSDYDMNIHANRSGKDWADFFIKTMEEVKPCIFERYNKEEVRETMMAWFCNAMMAMHDSIFNDEVRKLQAENEKWKSGYIDLCALLKTFNDKGMITKEQRELIDNCYPKGEELKEEKSECG